MSGKASPRRLEVFVFSTVHCLLGLFYDVSFLLFVFVHFASLSAFLCSVSARGAQVRRTSTAQHLLLLSANAAREVRRREERAQHSIWACCNADARNALQGLKIKSVTRSGF